MKKKKCRYCIQCPNSKLCRKSALISFSESSWDIFCKNLGIIVADNISQKNLSKVKAPKKCLYLTN